VLSATEIQQFTQVLTHNNAFSDVDNQLQIAPNPAYEGFEISISGLDRPARIEIYTVEGKKVYENEIETHLLISNEGHQIMPKGMYIVKVFQAIDRLSWTEKLIIN